jgi:hypothetical protein
MGSIPFMHNAALVNWFRVLVPCVSVPHFFAAIVCAVVSIHAHEKLAGPANSGFTARGVRFEHEFDFLSKTGVSPH